MTGLRIERREVTSLADGYYGDVCQGHGQADQADHLGREHHPGLGRPGGPTGGARLGCGGVGGDRGVTVVSKAKALEDGDLGQVITVEHLVTRRHLTGTVTGRGARSARRLITKEG